MMRPDIAAKYPTFYEFIQKHKIKLFLAVLFSAKLIFQIFLFREGFISVSADEFSRGIRAMHWAENPYWVLGETGWLPFELYLNGLALMLWDHVILVPRITAFLASCWLLYFFFRLTYYLFSEYMVAVLSTVILACFPWYVWLSGTPMLDIYYMAFIVSGFYFLCVWLKEQKSGYLFWGGLSFFISSGFHYQSWVVVNSILLLTVFFLFGYFKNREYEKIIKLVIFYFFSNAYIILMSAATYVQTGSIATVFAKHSDYSKWFYHGYELSAFSKFMHYPKLLLGSTNILFHILFFVSLYFLFKEKDRLWKVICGAAGCFVLIFFSLFNIFSVPATAAPGRFVLPFFTLFSPYVAYSTYRLYTRQRMNILKPAVICLFIILLLPGIVQSLHFPKGMSQDSVKTGEYLNGLLDRPDFGKNETYMIEIVYWDFLGVKLTAKHYAQMVSDREINKYKRNIPSLFSKDIKAIYYGLLQSNTRYVALRNDEFKNKAGRLGTVEKEIGDWTIFKIRR